jgi:hypothetical protein
MPGERSDQSADAQSTDRWEIDQDEFGRPVVRHRHPVGTIGAYVAKHADGAWKATCPGCGEQLRIDAPAPPGL